APARHESLPVNNRSHRASRRKRGVEVSRDAGFRYFDAALLDTTRLIGLLYGRSIPVSFVHDARICRTEARSSMIHPCLARPNHAIRVPFGTRRSTVVITTPASVGKPVNRNCERTGPICF